MDRVSAWFTSGELTSSLQQNKNPLIIIVLLVAVIGSGTLVASNVDKIKTSIADVAQTDKKSLQIGQADIVAQGKTNIDKTHPPLYFFDLDYNPKNKLVTQTQSDIFHGDGPILLLDKPQISTDFFTVRVEVYDENQSLMRFGWEPFPVKLIKTKGNTYAFRVVVPYHKNGFVKVYLENNLIWTGKME